MSLASDPNNRDSKHMEIAAALSSLGKLSSAANALVGNTVASNHLSHVSRSSPSNIMNQNMNNNLSVAQLLAISQHESLTEEQKITALRNLAANQLLSSSIAASNMTSAYPLQNNAQVQTNTSDLTAQLLSLLVPASSVPRNTSISSTPPQAVSDVSSLHSKASGPLLATANQYSNVQNTVQNPVVAIPTSTMHNWSLSQLEQHVKFLQQTKQPVSQTVSMLLSEARRKEDRRNAKRIANRKSASSSRARKKAMVKEMTEMNLQLKRQALILALIPDIVVVINEEGVISFCSSQVERVLGYKSDELLGLNLGNFLSTSSQDKLKNLVAHLVQSSQIVDDEVDTSIEKIVCATNAKVVVDTKALLDESKLPSNSEGDGKGTLVDCTGNNIEPTFPMSVVVQVDSRKVSDEHAVSDGSGSKEPLTLTDSTLTRSATAESFANDGSDNHQAKKKDVTTPKATNGSNSSSDTSNTSAYSNNAAKLNQANENLERNVRWANRRLKDKALAAQVRAGFKDDVTGAAVTANNASARLSSLQHRPEPTSEEDSGYRESNESREETSSSCDSSECNGRLKPLAPTCTICLTKKDQTMIWCEVTSSVNSRDSESAKDESVSDEDKSKKSALLKPKAGSQQGFSESDSTSQDSIPYTKEFLLCLRPIQSNEVKVGNGYSVNTYKKSAKREVSGDSDEMKPKPSNLPIPSNDSSENSSAKDDPVRPMKKRKRITETESGRAALKSSLTQVKEETKND